MRDPSKTLLDVELFGCAQGSVSGASCDRRGVLEMVSGGTVILENIEAISARTRVALEQYLATGCVKGIGTVGPGIPESCKGLCPRCGVDRNVESCNCAEIRPESPFAVLSKLKGDA